MIKTILTGASSRIGGELIRILSMHPEVEIIAACAPGYEGQRITSVHHGLIGETTLAFSGSAPLEKGDILFICDSDIGPENFNSIRKRYPELRIVILAHASKDQYPDTEIVYGLPEINRKALVRGAMTATVPVSFESMALVALYPFASHLLLQGDISIDVEAPQAITDLMDLREVAANIERELAQRQTSFSGSVTLTASPLHSRRSALMKIRFACNLDLQSMLDLYEMYDDHRFAFVTTQPVGVSEVAGTNKCVITVSKTEPGEVVLGAAADCRLRGGAGEAVHIMNLMFGLHERTGLALKAIDYDPV